MTVDNRTETSHLPAERQTLSDIVEQLMRFDGPPEQFLMTLLAVQCHICGAQGGAIIRPGQDGKTEVLSLFPQLPPDATAPVWLAQAVEYAPDALASGRPSLKPLRAPDELYGQPSQQHLIMVPIRGGTNVRGLSAFHLDTADPAVLRVARERLELTSSWLSLYEMRLTLQRRQSDLRRLRVTLETLVAVNDQPKFASTAMTLCNEVAARWQADRVGLGLLKGRYIKLKALSHTEKFSRKQKLIQDIEAAMEECVDQNVEIIHPAPEHATFVSRATSELCKRHGPSAVVSLPLRQAGEPIAVLSVHRPVDRPFSLEELESLRLACDLCTPRVAVLNEHDRWFGSKLASGTRKALAWAVGNKHTWAKLIVIIVLAAGLFITFAKGDREAEAPFALQARERQVVAAPWEGTLDSIAADPNLTADNVLVAPGANVKKGQLLAQLKTDKLLDQLARVNQDRIEHEGEARSARAAANLPEAKPDETAKQLMAEAKVEADKRQIALLTRELEEAEIRSPIDGTVLAGDWKQQLGHPFKLGETMFEIAPIEQLWAELSVPEDEISDVAVGSQGELASQAYPDKRVRFIVEQINPMAETVEKQNVFKVRVRLLDRQEWMRVGMEGVAKVKLGEEPYVKLWTRRLINWVRMKLWI